MQRADALAPVEEPTPKSQAVTFFTEPDRREATIAYLVGQGLNEDMVRYELDKFVAYWTEPTMDGKRERWQREKVFDVKRRLVTWFQRIRERGSRYAMPRKEAKGVRI